jgi:hypothetical protein
MLDIFVTNVVLKEILPLKDAASQSRSSLKMAAAGFRAIEKSESKAVTFRNIPESNTAKRTEQVQVHSIVKILQIGYSER